MALDSYLVPELAELDHQLRILQRRNALVNAAGIRPRETRKFAQQTMELVNQLAEQYPFSVYRIWKKFATPDCEIPRTLRQLKCFQPTRQVEYGRAMLELEEARQESREARLVRLKAEMEHAHRELREDQERAMLEIQVMQRELESIAPLFAEPKRRPQRRPQILRPMFGFTRSEA